MRIVLTYILFIVTISLKVYANGIKGKEFIFTPFPNVNESEYRIQKGERYYQISIVSDTTGNVSISIPHKKYNKNIILKPFIEEKIIIPTDYFNQYYNDVKNEYVDINSDMDISVYLLNITSYSSDGSIILPLTSLSNEYVINSISHQSNNLVQIVATEDSTELLLNSNPKYIGENKFSNKKLFLNKGDNITYSFSNDPSGLKVFSNKNLIVTNGIECLNIPDYTCCCDNSFHIVFPDNYLFNEYVVLPLIGRNNESDYMSIMSYEDNNKIYVNGDYLGILNSFDKIESFIDEVWYVKSEKKISINQYAISSQNFYPIKGDPFKLDILPINQMCDSISFNVIESKIIKDNFYTNILKYKDDECFINGKIISDFKEIPNSDFAYKRFRISKGNYNITTKKGALVVVYGYGEYDSYGFLAGACFKELPPIPTNISKSNINEITSLKGREQYKNYFEKYNLDFIKLEDEENNEKKENNLNKEIIKSNLIKKEIVIPPQVRYGFGTTAILTDITKSNIPNFKGFNSGFGLQFYISNSLALKLSYGIIEIGKEISVDDITNNINLQQSAGANLRINLNQNQQIILYTAPGIVYRDYFIDDKFNDGWTRKNGNYLLTVNIPIGVEWFFTHNITLSLQYDINYSRYFNKNGFTKGKSIFKEEYLGNSVGLNNFPTISLSYYIN